MKTSPKSWAWADAKSDGGDGVAKGWSRLIDLECRETKADLAGDRALLTDAPRPGAPGKFTPEQVTMILAVACEPPEKSGRPITHWTAHELADEVVKRGIVVSISTSQVSRYLREAALHPHKSRYWLNATEKDPVRFQEQVEAVCETYLAAPALERTQNTHTYRGRDDGHPGAGTDRCDQADDRRPAGRIEFEYKHHGTLTLIGNFQVTTGELIAPSIGPTRTEADFASHIEQTMATDPGGSWVFVADNLNIHCSETLVEVVAEACEITTPLGKKGVGGVLKSVATRQAFLSEESHSVRFVYTPKHSSWLNQIEGVFGVIMRKVIRVVLSNR